MLSLTHLRMIGVGKLLRSRTKAPLGSTELKKPTSKSTKSTNRNRSGPRVIATSDG